MLRMLDCEMNSSNGIGFGIRICRKGYGLNHAMDHAHAAPGKCSTQWIVLSEANISRGDNSVRKIMEKFENLLFVHEHKR